MFIYIAVKGLVKQGYKQYQKLESDAEHAFRKVYSSLKENDIESAKKFLEQLIGSEKPTNRRR